MSFRGATSSPNCLPKVPGYDFAALNPPTTFNKSQGLTFTEGVPAVKEVKNLPQPGSTTHSAATSSTFSEANIKRHYPEWQTLDNKVLRFFGYFTERVPESAVETRRIRKVVVLFYLGDRTMAVNEVAAGNNTGIRTGCMMSRHPAEVSVGDLKVGDFCVLRSRDFTLVDCDAFTRSFYEKLGVPQSEPISYPADSFAALQAAKTAPKPKDEEHAALKQSMEMAAAMASGRAVGTMTREERVRTESFLKHDREVLNFFGTWDKRLFRVSFFIADGTMAVTSVKAPNDGRDPVAAFVKRSKVPKTKYQPKQIDTISAPRGVQEECYTDADLTTGATINLFGRDFYLFDCDAYTREHYRQHYGKDMQTFPKGYTEGDGKITKAVAHELPPYNGYGTDEDSLGSVRHMVPKPPKKDYGKYIQHAQDVLRYSAEISSPHPEDEGRKFIVCYYLADDTVSVFEYAVRNSGHTGGKVFARAKMPSVTPDNMHPGSVIKLAGQAYRLIEADERTEKFLETGHSMGGIVDASAEDLLARVRICLTQRFLRLTEAYRHFSAGGKGIGFAELKRMFRECEVKLESDDMLARVMNIVDADGDGLVSLQEFVENVMKQSLAAPSSPPSDRSAKIDSASYLADQKRREKQQLADQALKLFIAKLEARRAFILDAFRIVSDRSVDGLIGADTFRLVVSDRLGLRLTPEEMDALVYRFYFVQNMPNWEQRRLSLRDFRKILEL